MHKWVVYRHTLPDGKIYIGITSKSLSERWVNGFGYEKQHKFFTQIVKYGWDNIKHEVVASNLDEKSVRVMEQSLINEIVSKDPIKCLNTHGAKRNGDTKNALYYLPFREDDRITRYCNLCYRFDDVWLERYHHLFDCYPHCSQVYDDAVYLYWYFDLYSPKIYRVPLSKEIITYGELWEHLKGGPVGDFVESETINTKEVC